jgi:hypothetical protein
VTQAVLAGRIDEGRLHELAPLVFAEAASDAVAAEIVDRLAEEVVALAGAALHRLDLDGEAVEVALGGGLIRAGDARLLAAIEAGLRAVDPHATVRPTVLPPVVGAALLGLDELGVDSGAHARIRRELTLAVGAEEDVDDVVAAVSPALDDDGATDG